MLDEEICISSIGEALYLFISPVEGPAADLLGCFTI